MTITDRDAVFAQVYDRQRTNIEELFDVLVARPAWHADANCREHPEVSFFPTLGESTDPAKAVCAGCLVRDECTAAGLDGDVLAPGVWGGLSRREREGLRRGRKRTSRSAA